MNEYLDFWRNFANFSGRTGRRGYWVAFLINMLVSTAIGLLASKLGMNFLATLYTYAAFVPGLSINVRRLRDAGCHWANLFWSFLPLIGTIILIVKLCKPSAKAVTA